MAGVQTARPRVRTEGVHAVLVLRREQMHGAGGCLIRTTYYLDRLRRRLAERLSRREYILTLQTQSLFDGHLPGVPHFVYTDHAELQCLRFPRLSPKDLFPPPWISLEIEIYRNASMVFAIERRHSPLPRGGVRNPRGAGGLRPCRTNRGRPKRRRAGSGSLLESTDSVRRRAMRAQERAGPSSCL